MARSNLHDRIAGSVAKMATFQEGGGSGRGEAIRAKVFAEDIQRVLGHRIPATTPNMWATNIIMADQDDVGSDELLAVQKTRDGLLMFCDQFFAISQAVTWASNQTHGFSHGDYTAEPIRLQIRDSTISGIRFTNGRDIRVAFAIRNFPGAKADKRRAARDMFVRKINDYWGNR